MSNLIDKNDAKEIIDRMPDNATWDDLIHEICLRIAVERGLADVAAGRSRPVEEVQARFGLPR